MRCYKRARQSHRVHSKPWTCYVTRCISPSVELKNVFWASSIPLQYILVSGLAGSVTSCWLISKLNKQNCFSKCHAVMSSSSGGAEEVGHLPVCLLCNNPKRRRHHHTPATSITLHCQRHLPQWLPRFHLKTWQTSPENMSQWLFYSSSFHPPPKTTPSDSQHYKLGEVITSGTRSSAVQRGEFIITHLKKKSRPVVSSSRANYLQGRAVRAPLRGCEVKFTAEDREVVRKQRGQRRRRGTGEGCK